MEIINAIMPSLSILRKYIRESLLNEDLTRDDLEGASAIDWVEAAWQQPELFLDSNIKTEQTVPSPAPKINLQRREPKPKRMPDIAGPQFVAMQRAAEEFGLRMINKGSSRIVYDLRDGTVLKLALNTKGIAQNSVEAFAGQDPMINKIVANVKEKSNEFAWLVSKKVVQLNSEREFEELTGVTWEKLREALGKTATAADAVTAKPQRSKTATTASGGGACLRGENFIQYLKNYLERYSGMLPGDILKYDSWGKTDDGCVVLLDYGISEATFKKLYQGR